ncbi:hypothetical protein ACGFYQ_27405 [Streptomyces sp. NPDC048258]|uniref:hypothetical protein n=1 Tax=Streptomyces sp. NPDC048258 TaxID=3365527 RepID=UPI00371A3F9D
MTTYDAGQVRAYLGEVFRGCSGQLALAHQGRGLRHTPAGLQPTIAWTEDGTYSGPREAAVKVRELYARQQPSMYVRMTTVHAGVTSGTRGVEADTAEVVTLWADIDIAGPGHKTGEPLPPDLTSALKVVDALPEPTLVVHSGGGIYPLWLLETPLVVTGPEVLAEAKTLSMAWQLLVQRISQRYGWTYGTGVGDLARVLRVAGTVNPKVPDNPRPCRILHDGGPRYMPETLDAWVREQGPDLVAEAKAASRPRSTAWGTGQWAALEQVEDEYSPGGVLSRLCPVSAVLEPVGWALLSVDQRGVEYWRRPSDGDYWTSPYSAKWNVNGVPVLVVWSESAGLPTGSGQKLTILRLLAHLHCDGDLSRATRGVLAAAAREALAPEWAADLPGDVLDEIRECCITSYCGTGAAA